jgi:hypothetical protein
MIRCFLLMAFAVIPLVVRSQSAIPLNSSPVSLSMSGCDVAFAHPFSALGNPATVSFLPSPLAGMFYERRYNLSQLSTGGLSLFYPSKFGGIGLVASQFGYSHYQSSRYALSYSRLFANKVAAAFQLNLRDEYQVGNAHVSKLFSDIGLVYLPSSSVSVGVHFYNPEQATLNYPSVDVALPSFVEMGLQWQALSHTKLFAEVEQYLGYPTEVSAAFESNYNNLVFVRAGYRLTANYFSWGMGARFTSLRVDVGFSYQMPLGMVSSAALAWEFQPQKR